MAEVIHFDCRYIRVDHHDGISRYSASLFTELAKLNKVIAVISDPRQLDHLPAGTESITLNDPTSPLEAFAALKLNRKGVSVLYSPMQTIGSFGRRFKLVLTLHDLIYYRHKTPPPSMPLAVRIGWRLFHLTYLPQRWLLNGADAVVTVSHTSAKLMRLHRLTRRPISVIYNAAEGEVVSTPRSAPQTRILVYMGSFMAYKNVATLIQGMESLPGYQLHLLSRVRPEVKARLMASAPAVANQIVWHNGVSDQQYLQLVDQAFALVHASQDEGFGIPVVEALGRGTPVVVSDIPIFHEIADAAGVYFNQNNPADFAAAVHSLEAGETWEARSAAGIERARCFSWSQSAQDLLQTLRSL